MYYKINNNTNIRNKAVPDTDTGNILKKSPVSGKHWIFTGRRSMARNYSFHKPSTIGNPKKSGCIENR